MLTSLKAARRRSKRDVCVIFMHKRISTWTPECTNVCLWMQMHVHLCTPAPVFWRVILIGSCCTQFMVGAWAEAAVPLAVYFIPALIKVKFQLSPISTHLSVSVEAAVWFVFLFFVFSSSRQIWPLIPFCLQPNRVALHLKVDYFNK